MLKRIRIEASRKSGSKILVIMPDMETHKATDVTILGGGASRLWGDSQFVWLETADQLLIDGEHVP